MGRSRAWVGAGLVTALAACAGGPQLIEREAEAGASRFEAKALVALSDVDMAGTAYANGKLEPLEGAKDALALIASETRTGEIVASNSVMAWPGALEVGPGGAFAYVVETRGPAPGGLERMKAGVFAEMPVGRALGVFDLADPTAPRLAASLDAGREPTAISVSSDGAYALVSRRDASKPLGLFRLENGVPAGPPIEIALPALPADEKDQGALFVRFAPDGRSFAVNIANTHVQFGRIEDQGARLIGEPVPVGGWLSVLRWTGDGRHVIGADVGWGPSRLDNVTNGPGALVSVAFDPAGAHRVASRAEVSLSPEGFELSPDGRLAVAVNMESTYRPDGFPYALFGRRERASLSLVTVDPATGALRAVDGPVAFDGLLPEDAVFDADGDMVAVAVFHERGGQDGFVSYFKVDRGAGGARLIPTGRRTLLARGVHDLAVVP